MIAQVLGIAPRTLRKHYAVELENGREIALAAVVNVAYKLAVSGNCPAATFFYLKTQGGWRETDRVEHEHRHSGQVAHVPVPLSNLSQATLDMIEADLAKELPERDGQSG